MKYADISEIIFFLDQITLQLKIDRKKALVAIRNFSKFIDKQVPFRDGHAQRVCAFSLKIGKQLRLTDNQLIDLEVAALLHDFGKIGISERLLTKTSPLTEKEQTEIRRHVIRGYYLLQGYPHLNKILEGVRTHHEKYDGTGYPFGLVAAMIPLSGRIIAVADAFDAMTSFRPYRRTKSKAQAIMELQVLSGKHFDASIVDAFIKLLDEKNINQ